MLKNNIFRSRKVTLTASFHPAVRIKSLLIDSNMLIKIRKVKKIDDFERKLVKLFFDGFLSNYFSIFVLTCQFIIF